MTPRFLVSENCLHTAKDQAVSYSVLPGLASWNSQSWAPTSPLETWHLWL